jgi:hypothetical protein
MLNTDNWVSYPFSVEGVNFVSKLDPQGSFYPQVERLPADLFADFNRQTFVETIGNPNLLTPEELEDELNRVNEGATQALICLA